MSTKLTGKYPLPAILLHWSMALLIAGLLGIGWYMMEIEDDPGSAWYFQLHKSFGIVLFALLLVRLVWRARHQPAPLPGTMPAWQVRLSGRVQWLLYACMALLPVLGFIGALYSKKGVALFGMPFPAWLTPDHDTAEQFFGLHSSLAWAMVGLVVLHAAAGLKHLLLDKDGVFQRMWF